MSADDESSIARVLRAAGGRAAPADDMKAAVRAAVHAEWQATVSKRRRLRRTWAGALAASAVAAAFALWIGRASFAEGAVVASVSRAVGSVESRPGSLSSWNAVAVSDQSAPASAGARAEVRVGSSVRTGSDGRVALQLRDGVSLRLDHNTLIAVVDANQVDVKSGAVYVDAGPTATETDHLRVGTPAGIVQHVGTQYEARIVHDGTRISVREGRVDLLAASGNAQSAGVGEQLFVGPSGVIQRTTIAAGDPLWEWAAGAAPAFDIDGRPVREFLSWVSRELGREVVYADPESEAEANRAVLTGSVSGLTPAEALPAVLATTQLRSAERDGKIVVTRQPNP